jgi:RHS repeat-associated protein
MEQRVHKQGPTAIVATGSNSYVYDNQGHLIGEYDVNQHVIEETVYLDDLPVAVLKQTIAGTGTSQSTGTHIYYVYADHINTPRVITQATDNRMVWRWDNADPFGLLPPNENPGSLGVFTYNQRFPGQVYDKETNNFYNVNRDYDPQQGRYIQSDPIGLGGGINTYSYVGGNPLIGTDSSGLFFDETGAYLAPAATAVAVATAPVWTVAAAAGGAGAATYQACHPDNDEKCKKLLSDIYDVMNQIEGRLSDLYLDRFNQYNFAYDKPNPSLPSQTTYTETGIHG